MRILETLAKPYRKTSEFAEYAAKRGKTAAFWGIGTGIIVNASTPAEAALYTAAGLFGLGSDYYIRRRTDIMKMDENDEVEVRSSSKGLRAIGPAAATISAVVCAFSHGPKEVIIAEGIYAASSASASPIEKGLKIVFKYGQGIRDRIEEHDKAWYARHANEQPENPNYPFRPPNWRPRRNTR